MKQKKILSVILKLLSASEEQKKKAIYKLGKVNFYQGNLKKQQKNLSQILGNLKDNSANDAIELLLLLNPQMNDSFTFDLCSSRISSKSRKFDEGRFSTIKN